MLDHKPFMIILGATGSGKTTLLNALLDLLNPEWKILTIEDTPELKLHNPYWVRFIARKSFDPSLEVSLFDLAMLALRYRPDFLVIGEVRGREIEALVHSATSGHGTITTFHGLEPSDVLVRVNALLNRDIAHLFVTTITNFVTVTDVVENGERKRKVVAVYEKSFERKKFLKLPLPNPNEVTESEVEDLVNKSGLVRKITESMGKPIDYAIKDILRRAEFLKRMVEKGADVNELQRGVKAFYRGG